MTEPPQILYQFAKPRATVRAYVQEYRGKQFAHIREFVEPHDQPGAPLISTKAGITVELGDLDQLRACVDALAAAVFIMPSSAAERIIRCLDCRNVLGQWLPGGLILMRHADGSALGVMEALGCTKRCGGVWRPPSARCGGPKPPSVA